MIDGIVKALAKPQSAGHNVQLLDFVHKRIADIETALNDSIITHINAGDAPLFHANMYVNQLHCLLLSACLYYSSLASVVIL